MKMLFRAVSILIGAMFFVQGLRKVLEETGCTRYLH